MPLLESDLIKLKILKALSDDKAYTYYALRKKTNFSYNTLKPNCAFLEIIGAISILSISKEESATNTSYSSIRITNLGWLLLDSVKGRFPVL